jgi:hypothetical protein
MTAQVTGESLSVQYVMRGVRVSSEYRFSVHSRNRLRRRSKVSNDSSMLRGCQAQKAQPDGAKLIDLVKAQADAWHAALHPNFEHICDHLIFVGAIMEVGLGGRPYV